MNQSFFNSLNKCMTYFVERIENNEFVHLLYFLFTSSNSLAFGIIVVDFSGASHTCHYFRLIMKC